MAKRKSTPDLFWEKVAVTDANDCHLFTAYIHKGGYGVFSVKGRLVQAHRYAWELAHGPIPYGMHVLHRCDVRNCVNWRHLFLGTDADNSADKVAKGRQSRGERSGSAKLSDSVFREIRTSIGSLRYIGALYGISHTNVRHIRAGKIWAHVS